MTEKLSGIKAVFLDMDGVLWCGPAPTIDIKLLFELIVDKNINVVCITNNSARTVEYYLEKLSGYGVYLSLNQIISSAEASGIYLKKRNPEGGNVFVVGEEGLIETLNRNGFIHVDDPALDNINSVVVGLDRNLSYQKMAIATRLISSGVPFIGTNPDKSIPIPGGIAPGAGSIIRAIEAASGVKAIIIGKPENIVFQLALEVANCDPGEVIMIGDRLETDMLGAQRVGIQTGLVLTGVTDRTQAETWDPALTMIAGNAIELVERII